MPKKVLTYREQVEIDHIQKIRVLLSELPPYITAFFRGRENTTTVKTRISYAYDLRIFFNYLLIANPIFKDIPIGSISLSNLEPLTITDFEEYQEYLKAYEVPSTGIMITNDSRGIAQKLSTLRSLFSYLYKRNMISTNEAAKIEMHLSLLIKVNCTTIADTRRNICTASINSTNGINSTNSICTHNFHRSFWFRRKPTNRSLLYNIKNGC